MEKISLLHILTGISITFHGFTVVQLYDIRNSLFFKLAILCNVSLAAAAISLFWEDDFDKIIAIFEYFGLTLTDDMYNMLAYNLVFIILITTIIAFVSLIIGPGKLFNNPGEKSKL